MTSEIVITHPTQSITQAPSEIKIIPMALLWESFLLAAGQRSKHTAKSYQSSVGAFLGFLGELQAVDIARPLQDGRKTVWEIRGDTTPLLDVDLATLDRFSAWLQNKGNEQTTINIRLAGVNSFLRVALRDKVISRDQGIDLDLKPYKARQRRNEQPVGRRLEPQEVKALRSTVELRARNENKMIRDRAILDFALYAALRRDEIANLDLSNFVQDGGRWWVVLTGKGNKTRRIKIHDKLYQSLTAWLGVTGGHLGNGDAGAVFWNLTKGGNRTGKQLNASVIGRLVAEYGSAAGLAPRNGKNRLSPHDLRRTCAKAAHKGGAPIEHVQKTLGHANVKTTMRYIGYDEDDTDTAIDYLTAY